MIDLLNLKAIFQKRLVCHRDSGRPHGLQLAPSDPQNNSVAAMVVSLQRRLASHPADSGESRFFTSSLQFLCTLTGPHIDLEDWMVSAFDVDFGPKIGEGGL